MIAQTLAIRHPTRDLIEWCREHLRDIPANLVVHGVPDLHGQSIEQCPSNVLYLEFPDTDCEDRVKFRLAWGL